MSNFCIFKTSGVDFLLRISSLTPILPSHWKKSSTFGDKMVVWPNMGGILLSELMISRSQHELMFCVAIGGSGNNLLSGKWEYHSWSFFSPLVQNFNKKRVFIWLTLLGQVPEYNRCCGCSIFLEECTWWHEDSSIQFIRETRWPSP